MHRLLEPHTILYVLLAAGVVALWRVRPPLPRRALRWLTFVFVLLSILSLPIVSYLALGSLEWHYAPLAQRPEDADAIVVLSGYVRPPRGAHPAELGDNTLYRCLGGAAMYHQGKRCPIIVTGGFLDPDGVGPSHAAAMRIMLLKLGVEDEDIVLEDRATTTYENAVYSAALLQQRGLVKPVLVTDATHLLRSELCFRSQGIDVVPCGARYRATRAPLHPWDLVPNVTLLGQIDQVAHEWLGLAWYWLRGRI
jgi:uncharacterized SAM-binding protein YcdF (DUF218 family)